VQTYAALLERRLIVPSASQPYLAIDQHFFFFDQFTHALSHIYFDEAWYLAKYRDIPEAVEKGMVASARHHYVRFGFYEHRLPYKIAVDEAWYLETYPDVKTAVEKRTSHRDRRISRQMGSAEAGCLVPTSNCVRQLPAGWRPCHRPRSFLR
jgi:hypothetical protein